MSRALFYKFQMAYGNGILAADISYRAVTNRSEKPISLLL